MTNPETSIVIRTFNEEKHLPGLLEAVRLQAYQDFELIVVDSGSLDLTRDIAGRYCDKVLQISGRDFTFGYSLNVGIRNSVGRFIVVVSAHTEPVDASWLTHLIAPLRDERTAMVYGRQLGGTVSNFAELQDFRRTFGARQRILQTPDLFANNANSAVRRDLWEQHPFDESLPGLEDTEWARHWMEKGYRVIYEPEAAIYHLHQENWRQVQRRFYREGVAARWIGTKGWHHIPLVVLREGVNLAGDLFQAARQGCLVQTAPEIALFRAYKTLSTAKGLLDGAVMDDPRRREAIFFDRIGEAVVIRGPGRASLDEVEIPPLKPGDTLIKVAYEAVCGTDLEIFDGSLGYYKSGMAKYPITPGHEFSGRVVIAGPNVKHLQEGDPVVVECIQGCSDCDYCSNGNWIACTQRKEVGVIGRNGAYAEYVVVPGHFVHKLPDDTDLKKACLCEPIAVVLKGLKRLERVWGPGEKKRCAIVGVGPIGHLCARILALRGHQVTAFDRNPLRRTYFEGSDIQTAASLGSLADFDTLIEATGDPEALDAILHRSAPGAALLLLGLPYARRGFSFENIVAYDKIIVGSVGSSAQEFREAIELLPQLEFDLFTEKVFPLEQFSSAWETFKAGQYLKIILEVDPRLNSKQLSLTKICGKSSARQ